MHSYQFDFTEGLAYESLPCEKGYQEMFHARGGMNCKDNLDSQDWECKCA